MAKFIPNNEDDLTKVDASPTKAFFVEIITRDIQLDQAIQDLVDNCIDGAKRLRPGSNQKFDDLFVEILFNADKFVIRDNCGGIPLEVARKYAFKFGRAKGFERTSHSVGQFGVGMKRALFKMGDEFSVTSREPKSSFRVRVDVPEWSEDDESWDFDVLDLEEKENKVEETGTEIEVIRLAPAVSTSFQQDYFHCRLRDEIRVTQQHPMRRGLSITLNGETIIPIQWQLKEGEGISPAFRRFQDDFGESAPLITRLYAGVGDSSKSDAGWYVFCNGRCILEANQDQATGWSEIASDGVGIPKYHGQFARFRGYAFLDSDDSEVLPWNTTKTGLDMDSDAYRRLKGRLIEITRPVIDFLNDLDSEQDFEQDDKVLSEAITQAPNVVLEKLPEAQVFAYSAPPKRGPKLSRISYQRPKGEADALKQELGASSNKEIGEKSFDFAYSNLVEDD